MTVWLATIALAIPMHDQPKVHPCRTRDCHHRVVRRNRGPWQRKADRLHPAMKAKLYRVRMCESGGDYGQAGYFRGAYQYLLSTAFNEAGFKKDPATLTSREGRAEQDVRTARFAGRVGWGPWPVCGFR